MANDERPAHERAPGNDAEVGRKRDELLAAARERVEGRTPDDGPGTRLMGLGLQFVVVILVALYAGMWLDTRLHTAPWFLLAGVLVGASLGIWSMYRAMIAEDRRIDDAERKR